MRLTGLGPLVGDATRVLILGTFPGTESLKGGRYYEDPRNKFWDIVAGTIRVPRPAPYDERSEALLRSGLGVWDVIASCERDGSLDGAITDAVPNDLGDLLAHHPGIKVVLFNGDKPRVYLQQFTSAGLVKVPGDVMFDVLPSSSGARAMKPEVKAAAWEEKLVEHGVPSPGRPAPNLVLLRGAPGSGKTEVATAFAELYGWKFIEVDAVKRERHGTAEKSDPEDFREAGRRARAALDAGRNVIAEEFFGKEQLVALFLAPTDLTVESANVVAVRLECKVEVAVARKTSLNPGLVRAAHGAWATRHTIPREIAIDTTEDEPEQVVKRMALALAERGVALDEPPGAR